MWLSGTYCHPHVIRTKPLLSARSVGLASQQLSKRVAAMGTISIDSTCSWQR